MDLSVSPLSSVCLFCFKCYYLKSYLQVYSNFTLSTELLKGKLLPSVFVKVIYYQLSLTLEIGPECLFSVSFVCLFSLFNLDGLFHDLGAAYLDVFSLGKFIKLHT